MPSCYYMPQTASLRLHALGLCACQQTKCPQVKRPAASSNIITLPIVGQLPAQLLTSTSTRHQLIGRPAMSEADSKHAAPLPSIRRPSPGEGACTGYRAQERSTAARRPAAGIVLAGAGSLALLAACALLLQHRLALLLLLAHHQVRHDRAEHDLQRVVSGVAAVDQYHARQGSSA